MRISNAISCSSESKQLHSCCYCCSSIVRQQHHLREQTGVIWHHEVHIKRMTLTLSTKVQGLLNPFLYSVTKGRFGWGFGVILHRFISSKATLTSRGSRGKSSHLRIFLSYSFLSHTRRNGSLPCRQPTSRALHEATASLSITRNTNLECKIGFAVF